MFPGYKVMLQLSYAFIKDLRAIICIITVIRAILSSFSPWILSPVHIYWSLVDYDMH